jgi:hypothetical protein
MATLKVAIKLYREGVLTEREFCFSILEQLPHVEGRELVERLTPWPVLRRELRDWLFASTKSNVYFGGGERKTFTLLPDLYEKAVSLALDLEDCTAVLKKYPPRIECDLPVRHEGSHETTWKKATLVWG